MRLNMRVSLYQKFFVWCFLNLALISIIPAIIGGWLIFGPSDKFFPPSWFSDKIHSKIRDISTEMQYRTISEWGEIIVKHSSSELDFYVMSMDHHMFVRKDGVPKAVLDFARQIPRAPYDLCLDELRYDNKPVKTAAISDLQAGLAPDVNVVFLYDGESGQFWFARPVFIMDSDEIPNFMLLAVASSSITGYGNFFDLKPAFLVLALILLITFLWWLPFIMHLTRPLSSMTEMTEKIAGGDYSRLKLEATDSHKRRDEIGRLGAAIESMAEQVSSKINSQQSFLRNIAHELGSPLTRIKLGLAVIETQVSPAVQERVESVSTDLDSLETLINDVISYLRAETAPDEPRRENVLLRPLLQRVVDKDGVGADVRVLAGPELALNVDVESFCRAVSNMLRNAVRYAGGDGPIIISAEEGRDYMQIEVADEGHGVPEEELELILKPFYRGKSSAGTSGTGLGLAIVKNSVDVMNGSVTCRNRVPHGFVITIKLPKQA